MFASPADALIRMMLVTCAVHFSAIRIQDNVMAVALVAEHRATSLNVCNVFSYRMSSLDIQNQPMYASI